MLALSAIDNSPDAPRALFLVDLTTYQTTQVITDSSFSTSGFVLIMGVSFSPDDSKLTFGLRSNDQQINGIYSVNIDGTGLTKLAKKVKSTNAPDWWVGSK